MQLRIGLNVNVGTAVLSQLLSRTFSVRLLVLGSLQSVCKAACPCFVEGLAAQQVVVEVSSCPNSVGSKNDGGSAFALCPLIFWPESFVPLHCETHDDGTAEREGECRNTTLTPTYAFRFDRYKRAGMRVLAHFAPPDLASTALSFFGCNLRILGEIHCANC